MKIRIVLLAYLNTLLTTAGLAWIFYTGFLHVSGHTLSLENLRREWDFLSLSEAARIFSDFLTDFGLQAFLYLIVLYFFQHFFTAGLLDAVVAQKLKFSRFILQGIRKTPAFFGLHLLLSTFGMGLLFVLVFLGSAVHKNLTLPDHRNVFLAYAVPLIIFLLIFLFLYMLWDYTRLNALRGVRLGAALRSAYGTLRKQGAPWRYFGLFLGAMLLSTAIYRLLSPYLYPVLFLAQQAFIFVRVVIRWTYLWHIAAAKPGGQ